MSLNVLHFLYKNSRCFQNIFYQLYCSFYSTQEYFFVKHKTKYKATCHSSVRSEASPKTLPYVRPRLFSVCFSLKGNQFRLQFQTFPNPFLKAAEEAATAIRKLKTLPGNAKTFTLM